MGSLNVFIRMPSFPSTDLLVLIPPSPAMVQPTRKQKNVSSKDTDVKHPKKRSRRAVDREISFESKSSHREHLEYADLVSQVLGIAATPQKAEITILELMREYSFNLATLKDLLRGMGYFSELNR